MICAMGRVAEKKQMVGLLTQRLCCNMVYFVMGWVLLIEFLPLDMRLIVACVSAAAADWKPNTGAQVVQQSGEWLVLTVIQPTPSVMCNRASPVVGVSQNGIMLSFTNAWRDSRRSKLLNHLCTSAFLNFILHLLSIYNWDFISRP